MSARALGMRENSFLKSNVQGKSCVLASQWNHQELRQYGFSGRSNVGAGIRDVRKVLNALSFPRL